MFLVLVALGAGLAGLEPVVIVALVAVALVLVALVERAYEREAGRSPHRLPADEPEDLEVSAVDAASSHEAPAPAEPEPEPEPELAVSERSARAILASAPPPVTESAAQEPEPGPRAEPEPELEPEPEPEPELEPQYAGPREWNIWDLQGFVRDRPDDPRHDEWTALILSLRDFASPDGTLPHEFDGLVRESFGSVLANAPAEAATTR